MERLKTQEMQPDSRFQADLLSDSDNAEQMSSDSDDEDVSRMTKVPLYTRPDNPPEYWQLQKMLKFLKATTPNVTVVVLGYINDLNLDSEFMQLALGEAKLLDLLVNLLETSARDFRCKKLSLLILSKATRHVVIQRKVASLSIAPLLVNYLMHSARDIQKLAAAVVANVAQLKQSSKQVRECGGIPLLVHLLDLEESVLKKPKYNVTLDDIEKVEVTANAARALRTLSSFEFNKVELFESGIINIMPKLLQARYTEILIHTMGILQNCGNLTEFQIAIHTRDLVKDIVRLFGNDCVRLKELCALAMFKHSEEERIRKLVRKHGGLTPLVRTLQQETTRANKNLLAAVTGAVWKLAISEENVRHLETVDAISTLVKLLDVDDEKVLVHVTGALAECGKLGHNAATIKRAGGIPPLVNLLNRTNQPLLANTAHALGECAWDMDCMSEMEQQDAVRLIWSLLKNPCTRVQANAAWALVPCIRNATESGEMVRSFVGGVELIMKRLNSSDSRVVACTCAALTQVATDPENLAVMSDLGVVALLSDLCRTAGDDQFLQEHVAVAVASCCGWGKNCYEFGRQGAVPLLVKFLYHSNPRVKSAALQALSQLSADPFNCIIIHQNRVVPLLIKAVGSPDRDEQRAAATCLSNIRKLAIKADRFRTERNKKRLPPERPEPHTPVHEDYIPI